MKKVINGKVYDSEKAKFLDSDSYGAPGDASYWKEWLYQKRTGEFFLFGEGGPMSKYSRILGDNSWGYGEEIIPLSYEAAQKWAEEHLSAEAYEKIFGEISESSEKIAVLLSISASALDTAKRAAVQDEMSLSAYIEKLIGDASRAKAF